jgi:hypothetical protein
MHFDSGERILEIDGSNAGLLDQSFKFDKA